MSELEVSEVVENVTAFIGRQEVQFTKLNENCFNRLDFVKECEFAKQQLIKNDYTLNAARLNPDSLQSAISNVAAIGISLNPAMQYAYLVPRKIKKEMTICLDISYRGLIKLATDTGIIKAVKAELIYESDDFEYHGFHEAPKFTADPFGDRGELKGVYAMALLMDGGVLVETMPITDVNKIRDDSEAYKSAIQKGGWTYDNNVWVKYYTEMVKKTVIKRAFKTLPPSKGTEQLGQAIDVINEHEGIEFDKAPPLLASYTNKELLEFKRCIDDEDSLNLYTLMCSLDPEAQLHIGDGIVEKPPRGKIGSWNKAKVEESNEAARQLNASIDILRELIDSSDDDGVTEIVEDYSQWTLNFVLTRLTPEHQQILNSIVADKRNSEDLQT